MKLFFLLFFILVIDCHGKLLDKIVAVVDERIITLSEIQRIQENLHARRNISPQIYHNDVLQTKDIVTILINTQFMASKLSEIGYKITDEQVEEQIKSTEQRLNLNRDALLKFLQENNITFNEYFEIIRSTIEYNIFKSRIIIPLISITEQQIKNEFFNKNLANKTLAFKYNLASFTIHKNEISPKTLEKLPEILKKFQSSGVLPEELKNLQTNELGNITEEGLEKELVEILKKTNEGSLSRPILMNGQYQVFYVRKKDLVESELYLSSKPQLKNELYDKEALKVSEIWFLRESQKHFIKYFF